VAIKLDFFPHLNHPSDLIPVYSKESVTVLAYRQLKWEYTWRNDDFFTKSIEIYKKIVELFKLGFIDKKADFSSIIHPATYVELFKSILQLQFLVDDWDLIHTRKKSEFEEGINAAIAMKNYLVRQYAVLLPKHFHKKVAIIRQLSSRLYNKYGYRGLLLDFRTSPLSPELIILAALDGYFPRALELDRKEIRHGDSGFTIDSRAIKIYDWKKYSSHKYEYDGDVLLSIDFSKTDETIINDIRLLIRQIRRENYLEPIYTNSEELEIKDKTKTKLSLKDYKTRLLGLWLADYKELHECGGSPAIEALRKTGYLERCGIKDNERALMRLIAVTERCIAAADVQPITSTP